MKKLLLLCAFLLSIVLVNGQTTYYWVGSGSGAANNNINTGANWNTAQNGTGSPRASSTGPTDILVFDGANLGGATPITGPVTVNANASITCAQMKFTGNVTINMVRAVIGGGGTSTITISGQSGDDWVIEAGSSFIVPVTTTGSLRFAMAAANSGKVSGTMNIVSTQQFRIDNTTAGTGILLFTSGSSLITNITSASSSYAFGNSTQSSERWVVFESGAHLYYDGGFSPNGSGNLFSAIDMKPGSVWHQRVTNALTGIGNFFNRKYYGDVIVENNSTLTAFGPIFQIGNLTVNSGCTFITHSSGQTAIAGNLVVDGSFSGPAAGTNELLFSGSTTQTVSGSGTISANSLIVADMADVVLNKNISVEQAVIVFGKINFGTNLLTGAATFKAEGIVAPVTGTASATGGSYQLTGNTGIPTNARGQRFTVIGPLAANTVIVGFSVTADTIYLSKPSTNAGTGSLTISTSGAVLETANTNGFNPASGTVPLSGTQTFNDGVSYVINAATTWPFGVTTSSTATPITARFIEINAPVTVNRAFSVSDHLKVNGKITLRPLDIVRIMPGANITGTFSQSNYIATTSNSGTGELSKLQYDGIPGNTTLPIGSANYYLPVSVNPNSTSSFTATVFEGITNDGAINGTPFTPSEKQNVVNAVWNINRLGGSGSVDIKFGWNAALEGSTFATLPDTDIGLITNNGTTWSLPIGSASNTFNTVIATVNSFVSFAIGAIPQVQPFLFNALLPKVYGDPDFNGGATSLNTAQPVIYTSTNPAVATIVAGNIHITGAGTTTINATQASDGFYPAATGSQSLTVNKAALTIAADSKTKFEGQANPTLTATYTGFVLGESPAVLLTPANITTTAVLASPPGTYPITVNGATSNNYTITFVNSTLTVLAKQNQTITFAAPATKTYGNADFPHGASSTNNTIPITFASSNPGVATVVGNNIHIVGAGTTSITASQAGNFGYFAAPDVTRTLIVNKANLAIKVLDTVKVQGQPNPAFTITYTGFVLSETSANLLSPVVASTTATNISSPGYYPITLSGAASNNYNITYTNGRLTILPLSGTAVQYINAFMSNSNTLTIRIYSPATTLGDVWVYDMNGRPVLRRNLLMPVGFISTDIPVSILASGLYIVSVRGDGVDLQKTIRIIR
ncbi:MAG: MBG domain-containing protein [Bacteroidota bacterium]